VSRLGWSLLILAALVAAGIGGYRIGAHDRPPPSSDAVAAERADGNNSPVIYYRDPDGKPFYSAEPKSTTDGRPWRAVHANEDVNFDNEGTIKPKVASSASGSRKILYYRNPWALPTSPRCRRRTRWGWTTSLSTKARTMTAGP
jgi:membrane fusion protein, copper/silver efflux system